MMEIRIKKEDKREMKRLLFEWIKERMACETLKERQHFLEKGTSYADFFTEMINVYKEVKKI